MKTVSVEVQITYETEEELQENLDWLEDAGYKVFVLEDLEEEDAPEYDEFNDLLEEDGFDEEADQPY